MTQFTLPIPIYHCYKRVQALKIKAVVPNPRGWELHFDDGRFFPVEVPHGWMAKHLTGDNGTSQLVGGYAVWNEDGYMSWLPAADFEAGYSLVPTIEWAKSWYEFTKGWPGGPSEVEVALASRDAEIGRLRHALELAGPVMDAHAGPSRLAEFVSAGQATQAARSAV